MVKDIEFKPKDNIQTNYFNFDSHQILTAELIHRYKTQKKLIINYDIGSGKTISMILAGLRTKVPDKPIYFIAAKEAKHAFYRDLTNPVFGFFTKEDNPTYIDIKRKTIGIIKFITYKKMFNIFFGNDAIYTDINDLYNKILNHKIVLNQNIISDLTDNIILIDEIQKLYNYQGLNSYAYLIMYLINKIPNLRVVGASGTIFNRSLLENINIINIYEGKIMDPYTYDNFNMSINIMKGVNHSILDPKHYNYFIDKLSKYYMFYKNPDNLNLPKVNYEGKKLDGFKELKLIPLEMDLTQYQICKNDYNVEEINEDSYNSFKNEMIFPISKSLIIHNNFQLKKYEQYNKNGYNISKQIVYSDDLKLKNIHKIGVIPKYVLQSIFDKLNARIKNSERFKSVIYHSLVKCPGVLQWAEILNSNGFIQYGSNYSKDTLCRKCLKTIKEHKDTNTFEPLNYLLLYGNTSDDDRKKILELYHNDNDIIDIILVTSVVEVSITLPNVTDMYILGMIDHMTQLQQIIGRVVRRDSHIKLPLKDRKVNIHIPVNTRSDNNFISTLQKNYLLKEFDYIAVKKYLEELQNNSINKNKIMLKHFELSYYDYLMLKTIFTYLFDISKAWLLDDFINVILNDRYNLAKYDISHITPENIINIISLFNNRETDNIIKFNENDYSIKIFEYNNKKIIIQVNDINIDSKNLYTLTQYQKIINPEEIGIDIYDVEYIKTNINTIDDALAIINETPIEDIIYKLMSNETILISSIENLLDRYPKINNKELLFIKFLYYNGLIIPDDTKFKNLRLELLNYYLTKIKYTQIKLPDKKLSFIYSKEIKNKIIYYKNISANGIAYYTIPKIIKPGSWKIIFKIVYNESNMSCASRKNNELDEIIKQYKITNTYKGKKKCYLIEQYMIENTNKIMKFI